MDDASSAPTGGDAHRRRRNLTIGVVSGVVLVVVAVIVVLLVASGSDNSPTRKKASPPSTRSPTDTITVPLGPISADSAGPAVTVSSAQAQQIVAALQTYVKDATLQPLRDGTVTANLAALFDPGTLAQAIGADRGVVFDEGLPKVTGDMTATAQPVAIVGLGDQGGALVLASADLDLNVSGTTNAHGQPLHIARKAEFVLEPGPFGVWRITSYRMVVVRTGGGLDTTTTTKAASIGTS